MNGSEDPTKRFVGSSDPFIKGLLLFFVRDGEFPDHQARELTRDECFNQHERGEIDAVTFEQMRERLEATNKPRSQ